MFGCFIFTFIQLADVLFFSTVTEPSQSSSQFTGFSLQKDNVSYSRMER